MALDQTGKRNPSMEGRTSSHYPVIMDVTITEERGSQLALTFECLYMHHN